MNKKTVSWAASVVMAGSLASAPLVGAQTAQAPQGGTMPMPSSPIMGGQNPSTGGLNKMGPGTMMPQQGMMQQPMMGQGGMMSGGQQGGMGGGQQMGGPMGSMMAGEGEMDWGVPVAELDAALFAAAGKDKIVPSCAALAGGLKAKNEDDAAECEDNIVDAAGTAYTDGMTANALARAIGFLDPLRAGMRSADKRARVVAALLRQVMRVQDTESQAQEEVANVRAMQAQRQANSAQMRTNMSAQGQGQMGGPMGMGGVGTNGITGNSMTVNGMGMNMPGAGSQGGPMGGPGSNPMGMNMGNQNGPMMSGVMNFGGGSPAKSADEAEQMARSMFRPTAQYPTYTAEMASQARAGWTASQSMMNGAGAGMQGRGAQPMGAPQNGTMPNQGMMPGGMMGGNQPMPNGQGGQMMAGQGGPMGMQPTMNGVQPGMGGQMGQPGSMVGGMGMAGQGGPMGGQSGQPMMGQPGQNNQGGMMQGGSMGNQPPMMMGGMSPMGGQGGQMMSPPQGGMPSGQPPPQGGAASAINTVGMSFWGGFFRFLGF